jgi:hypothetical protein
MPFLSDEDNFVDVADTQFQKRTGCDWHIFILE